MKVVVTGSGGQLGSEVDAWFDDRGHQVVEVSSNLSQQLEFHRAFRHIEGDIRDRGPMVELVDGARPDSMLHCAAQPSHDLAASRSLDDFDVNANGTLNLLEATRRDVLESLFVFMSMNKVYGYEPQELELHELATRWNYERRKDWNGVSESMRINQSTPSIFGSSKVAADVMVLESGRYFGMNMVCFRGGCPTGPNHSGAKLHGLLSHWVKAAVARVRFRFFGYKGKQARDQLRSHDVVAALDAFISAPRQSVVYNRGGGRDKSTSLLESISLVEDRVAGSLDWEYVEGNREGDHICYITDLHRFRVDGPGWELTMPLGSIIDEVVEPETSRRVAATS